MIIAQSRLDVTAEIPPCPRSLAQKLRLNTPGQMYFDVLFDFFCVSMHPLEKNVDLIEDWVDAQSLSVSQLESSDLENL